MPFTKKRKIKCYFMASINSICLEYMFLKENNCHVIKTNASNPMYSLSAHSIAQGHISLLLKMDDFNTNYTGSQSRN